LLALLHLCDSLFPVGAFGHSDGLEAAVRIVAGTTDAVAFLGEWMDVALTETIGRSDGPAVWCAWHAFNDADWAEMAALDEVLTALRPALAARRSSRAIGRRLVTTWSVLYPDARFERLLEHAGAGPPGPTLPVAFAAACASVEIGRHESVAAFAYTRLAATVSAAMRLLPIGQTDAHRLLARTLTRVPAVVDLIARRDAAPESFAPMLDLACMSQQYLHSRLFRS